MQRVANPSYTIPRCTTALGIDFSPVRTSFASNEKAQAPGTVHGTQQGHDKTLSVLIGHDDICSKTQPSLPPTPMHLTPAKSLELGVLETKGLLGLRNPMPDNVF